MRRLSLCLLPALALAGCVGVVPVAYAPPPQTAPQQAAYGGRCFAGVYTCAVASQPVGAPCACPGLGAPSYGVVQ